MKNPINSKNPAINFKLFYILGIVIFILSGSFKIRTKPADEVFSYLRGLGHGSYLFGQVGTWVHNENPDMDQPSNWIKKVFDHTGKLPKYGCITYDFEDNPFTDSAWNHSVKKMWDKGMLVGVFSWYANPAGKKWNDSLDIAPIFSGGIIQPKITFTNKWTE